MEACVTKIPNGCMYGARGLAEETRLIRYLGAEVVLEWADDQIWLTWRKHPVPELSGIVLLALVDGLDEQLAVAVACREIEKEIQRQKTIKKLT